MNEYLFYTPEGATEAPYHVVEVDNCQILGRAQGYGMKDARKNLLKHTPWIADAGFDEEKMFSEQILTKSQWADIAAIVKYLWHDEEKHYEESGAAGRKTHIFNVLIRLKEMCGTRL